MKKTLDFSELNRALNVQKNTLQDLVNRCLEARKRRYRLQFAEHELYVEVTPVELYLLICEIDNPVTVTIID